MAKKLRFKVGDRVVCARGCCIQSTGRITRRAPALATNGKPGADWVVRLDKPVRLGGTECEEVWFDDDELEPWTGKAKPLPKVPSARPCKHPRARAIVCMVPSPLGLTDMPISTFRTDGYVVKWCPSCGALQNKHPKRFGLQTRVMWRRPENGGANAR